MRSPGTLPCTMGTKKNLRARTPLLHLRPPALGTAHSPCGVLHSSTATLAVAMATRVSLLGSLAPTSRVPHGGRNNTRVRESPMSCRRGTRGMSFLKNGESGVGVFRARAVRGVSARFASRTTALCTPNSVHDALGPKPTPETNKVMGTDPIGSPQFLGNVAAKSTGLGTTFFTSLLVPALGAAALALVAACVAGFLVAVREMVRACREATIASRSVTRCAVSIDAACLALERTLIKADFVLEDVGKMSSTTSSVLETSLREAGVLQRRLSDLPNTASRTLMEAITRQYASPIPLTDGNGNVTTSKNGTGNAVNAQSAGVWAGDTRIVIGDVIEGTKDGNRWIGGTIGCNFQVRVSH